MKFKLLTPELQQYLQDDIFEFRQTFGLSVSCSLTDVDDELHTSLIVEELKELSDADTECDRMDAIVDSVYVLMGRYVHHMGRSNHHTERLQGILYMVDILLQVADKSGFNFIACWDEIHGSNMSKVCNDLDEVERTMDSYLAKGITTTCTPVNKYFVVKCEHDNQCEIKQGKVLKSIDYRPADLSNVLYK